MNPDAVGIARPPQAVPNAPSTADVLTSKERDILDEEVDLYSNLTKETKRTVLARKLSGNLSKERTRQKVKVPKDFFSVSDRRQLAEHGT